MPKASAAEISRRREVVLRWLWDLYRAGRFPRWFSAQDIGAETGVSAQSCGGHLWTIAQRADLPFALSLDARSSHTWKLDRRATVPAWAVLAESG